jgi:hypothetical protein
MANIGKVPSARELLDEPEHAGKYGDHLLYEKTAQGAIVLLTTTTRIVIAQSDATSATVDLHLLDATTVPYVNAFIAHTGQRVEKYWRTKAYRLVGGSASGPATQTTTSVVSTAPSAPALPVSTPSVTAAEETSLNGSEPTETNTEGVPAVFTAAFDVIPDVIPGVEHPRPVKVKGAGKGWTRVGDIVLPDRDYRTLTDAWTLRQNGVPSSVLITGPAGTAKTAIVRAFAASLGVPFLKVDGGAIRTADDWAGAFRQDPNTKTWAHRWSPFAQVLRKGEPTIVLIDEINRTESPQALNALLGLLDWTGQLLVPDANTTLSMPTGVLVVATANIGPEFVGTLPLDGAVRQRFPYGVRMGYPTEAIESALISDMTGVGREVTDRLVKMASLQRINREDPQLYPSGSVISTRVVLDIARRIATCGTDPREAVWATLMGQFDPGDETALSVAIDTQFPAPVEEEEITEVDESEQVETARCPNCSSEYVVGSTTSCPVCGYGLPTKPGVITLQR